MENIETEVRKALVNAYEKLIENYMQKYEFLLPYMLKTERYNGGSVIVEIENFISNAKTAQLRKNFQLLIYPGTITNFKSRFDLYLNYNIKDAIDDIYNGKKMEKILADIDAKLERPIFLKNISEIIEEIHPLNKWRK